MPLCAVPSAVVRLERAGRVAWMTDLHHPHKRAAGRKRRVLQLSVCLWCAFLGSVPRLPRRGAGVPRVCVRLRLPLHVAIRLPSLHFASRAATSCLPSVSLLPFADASIEAAVFQMDGIKRSISTNNKRRPSSQYEVAGPVASTPETPTEKKKHKKPSVPFVEGLDTMMSKKKKSQKVHSVDISTPLSPQGSGPVVLKVEVAGKEMKAIMIHETTTMGEVREQLLQKLCLGMSSKDLEVTKEQYAKYLFLTSRSDHIQPSDLAVDVADQDKKNGMLVVKFNVKKGDPVISGPMASQGEVKGADQNVVAMLAAKVQELQKELEKAKKEGSTQEDSEEVELLEKQNENLHKKIKQLRAKGSKKGRSGRLALDINNVVINKKLAEAGGSMATVYSAYVDGMLCACKEIQIEAPEDANAVENEIELLESLAYNKYIVRYFFHSRTEKSLRLYMTLYSGTLNNCVAKRKEQEKPYTPAQIAVYLQDICRGIQFLHSNRIIHRDLKSENIFVIVGDDGDIEACAVGDFDTAKQLSKEIMAKTVIGTPSYIAPEVLTARERNECYTFAADIYSFGMIVYELLTLTPPFENVNPLQLSMKIIKGEVPEIPSNIRKEMRSLSALYERCVDMDPKKRPTTDEVLATLQKLL